MRLQMGMAAIVALACMPASAADLLVPPTLAASGNAVPTTSHYAFDWLNIKKSICHQVTKAQVQQWQAKPYMCFISDADGVQLPNEINCKNHMERPTHEFLLFKTLAACQKEREEQLLNGETS